MSPHCSGLCLLGAEELVSYQETEKEASWRSTMMEEMQSIRSNNTWSLVDPPAG